MQPRPYEQDASQEERRSTLRNDQRQASTLLDQAKLSEQLDAGRYKSTIIGSEEIVRYPAASGPWSGPQPGPEEPLGVEINAFEPVGTPREIEASFAVLERAPLGRFPPNVNVGTASSTMPPAAPPRPTLRIRRLR
jgi:hypothetical protein